MRHIENLEKILGKVKQLQPHEFDFSKYITKFDFENKCGTVCCVLGYFPKWFPNCGVAYNTKDRICTLEGLNDDVGFITHLSLLIGISRDWIEYLFYAEQCQEEGFPKLRADSSLEEVTRALELVIEYFKSNPIEEMRPLDKYSLS